MSLSDETVLSSPVWYYLFSNYTDNQYLLVNLHKAYKKYLISSVNVINQSTECTQCSPYIDN